jgi:hypothetical protein
MQQLDLPTTLAAAGIDRDNLRRPYAHPDRTRRNGRRHPHVPRFPETAEIENLFWAAYNGESGAL